MAWGVGRSPWRKRARSGSPERGRKERQPPRSRSRSAQTASYRRCEARPHHRPARPRQPYRLNNRVENPILAEETTNKTAGEYFVEWGGGSRLCVTRLDDARLAGRALYLLLRLYELYQEGPLARRRRRRIAVVVKDVGCPALDLGVLSIYNGLQLSRVGLFTPTPN
jgi:hypothetical protein